MMVLATRYTSVNGPPGTRAAVMSPMVTGTAPAPGLASSRSAMGRDSSSPWTGNPPRAQRQGHPSGADGEFQRGAAPGQLREQPDGWVEN